MIAGAQTQKLRQRWQRLQCVAGSECVGRSIAHGTNMRRLCCTRRRPPAQKSCSLRCACPAPAELRIRSDKLLIRCSPHSGLQLAACRDAPASDRLLNPFRPSPPCDFRSSFPRHNLQRTEDISGQPALAGGTCCSASTLPGGGICTVGQKSTPQKAQTATSSFQIYPQVLKK
jgi:hypothetical protein